MTALVKGQGLGAPASIRRTVPPPTITYRTLVSAPNVQAKLATRLPSWTAFCEKAIAGSLLVRQTLIRSLRCIEKTISIVFSIVCRPLGKEAGEPCVFGKHKGTH